MYNTSSVLLPDRNLREILEISYVPMHFPSMFQCAVRQTDEIVIWVRAKKLTFSFSLAKSPKFGRIYIDHKRRQVGRRHVQKKIVPIYTHKPDSHESKFLDGGVGWGRGREGHQNWAPFFFAAVHTNNRTAPPWEVQ